MVPQRLRCLIIDSVELNLSAFGGFDFRALGCGDWPTARIGAKIAQPALRELFGIRQIAESKGTLKKVNKFDPSCGRSRKRGANLYS